MIFEQRKSVPSGSGAGVQFGTDQSVEVALALVGTPVFFLAGFAAVLSREADGTGPQRACTGGHTTVDTGTRQDPGDEINRVLVLGFTPGQDAETHAITSSVEVLFFGSVCEVTKLSARGVGKIDNSFPSWVGPLLDVD